MWVPVVGNTECVRCSAPAAALLHTSCSYHDHSKAFQGGRITVAPLTHKKNKMPLRKKLLNLGSSLFKHEVRGMKHLPIDERITEWTKPSAFMLIFIAILQRPVQFYCSSRKIRNHSLTTHEIRLEILPKQNSAVRLEHWYENYPKHTVPRLSEAGGQVEQVLVSWSPRREDFTPLIFVSWNDLQARAATHSPRRVSEEIMLRPDTVPWRSGRRVWKCGNSDLKEW